MRISTSDLAVGIGLLDSRFGGARGVAALSGSRRGGTRVRGGKAEHVEEGSGYHRQRQ